PVMFESTFPLAQAVAAGELPVGIGYVHSSKATIDAGAPLKAFVPDPAPVSLLYSFIPADAANPNTALLFIHWLATEEGALAYEEANSRGNPLLPGTLTQELITGRDVTDFPPARANE